MFREVNLRMVFTSAHVWALILFLTTSIVFINFQIYRLDPIIIVAFNLLPSMTAKCIIKTIRTHPGRVPLIWMFQRCQVKKYCLLCHNFKPDRAHHCSTCGICVLNMDHHCPWLSNCIGFYNRKSFMLSVFYAWLSSAAGIAICIPKVINYKQLQALDIITFLIPLTALCGMLVLLTIFLKFHLILILNNMTTIEHLEKKRALFPDNSPSQYSLGWYKNLQQVFGKNLLLWFVPTPQTEEIHESILGGSQINFGSGRQLLREVSSNNKDSDMGLQLGRMTIQKNETDFNSSRVLQSSQQRVKTPVNMQEKTLGSNNQRFR